ncbi:prepilin-type cleavage/methylation domain-containing protein [Pseudomonas sp. G11-1]|nr:prepilin-type cleavage/methylation domain-containing protein [Pseudomonas sp. G11-1]MCO5788523.1 prepilin-type cleavage/methylation domain-containing protein [Pseudomonas sp. G11-2]
MKRNQQGFTLIELMVAMLIGLILTLAALQLFMTNQRTFSLQQAVAELHEDGQQAIRYMVADIRQAGRGSALAGAIPPIDLINSSNGTNDALAVHYWGTSTCAGETYSLEREIHNVYSVNNEVLQCRSVLTNTTVDLVSGVESFQVLYGIDGNKDGELGVTQFVTANNLTADSVVVAIRFALLLSSDRFRQSQSANTTHWVLDQKVDSADSNLRRVFNSTVQLRNYDWEGV